MNLYYPGAIWRPGPPAKTLGTVNALQGILMHSMQGFEAGAWSVLDDDSVDADGYFTQPGAWHFSVMQDGRIFQHYQLDATPFHGGSPWANGRFVGIEHEGGPPGNLGEPLTSGQLAASRDLVRWVANEAGLLVRAGVTLFPHSAATNTRCPSGRIPFDEYEEDIVEVQKLVNADAINAVKEIVETVGAQQGEYLGKVTSGYPVPSGYTAYLVVSKDG